MSVPSDPVSGAAPPSRIISLDFIRGIAVLGIVAANVVGFGQPFLAYSWPGGFAAAPLAADPWLWTGQFVLIDGKMRGLFSLLFGAGLALFAQRASSEGEALARQARRLAWLLLFGIAHFYLLWRGDILSLYAMCGFLVMFAVRWPPAIQFAVGLVAYVAGGLSTSASYWAYWASGADAAGPASERADAAREIAIAKDGSYFDYVAHALGAHRWNWLDAFSHTGLETIPLMLMGAALYQAGAFDGRFDPRLQRRLGWLGIASGSAATLALALWAVGEGLSYTVTQFVAQGPQTFTRLPVILGLAAVLAPWAGRANGWLGQQLVAAGRMAFSNYLGTSLVLLFVFQPPGLRLFGDLDRIELYAVVLATWAVMLWASGWWLARHRQGPLETLWRTLTYGRPRCGP